MGIICDVQLHEEDTLIPDRTDLGGHLSAQFVNVKTIIVDNTVESIESRADLRVK